MREEIEMNKCMTLKLNFHFSMRKMVQMCIWSGRPKLNKIINFTVIVTFKMCRL